jgi:hypothetical protein
MPKIKRKDAIMVSVVKCSLDRPERRVMDSRPELGLAETRQREPSCGYLHLWDGFNATIGLTNLRTQCLL